MILSRHLGASSRLLPLARCSRGRPSSATAACPVMHRAGLAAALALVLVPRPWPPRPRPGRLDAVGWVLAVGGRGLVGLAIGFVAQCRCRGGPGGGAIGFQMGLTSAWSSIPPRAGRPGLVTRCRADLALLLFLAVERPPPADPRRRRRASARVAPARRSSRRWRADCCARGQASWSQAWPSPRPSSACSSSLNVALGLIGARDPAEPRVHRRVAGVRGPGPARAARRAAAHGARS